MRQQSQSTQQILRRRSRRAWAAIVVGIIMAAGFGVVAAKLVGGGLSALKFVNPPSLPGGIVVFSLFLAVPAILRWPRGALIALVAGTTVIDQFQYTIGPGPGGKSHNGVINVPLFRSLSKGSFVTPTEMILVILLLICLMKGAHDRCWHLPHSPLAKSIAAMYGTALVVGLGLGIAHHGQIKPALWELRPWYYLAVVYLLTSSFFHDRPVIRPLLWTLVIGSGLKSIEGVVNFFVYARKMRPRPDQILSHEEAFFFGVFLLTTLALWLFQMRGRLRGVATAFSPLVLLADLGNSRRTAFLILDVGLAALLVVAYVSMPERRPELKRINILIVVVSVAYIGAFWGHSGTLAQPARAVQSAVKPTARDLSSNQYRVIENINLTQGIHSTRSLGKGFGIPIDYGYAQIVNLSSIDSLIAFIPHNGVLYVWYRLGLLGEIVLWSMIGLGILVGCRLVKVRDREVAAFGAIAICTVIGYALMGYNDLGFDWDRIVIFVGFLLGALEVTCRRVEEAADAELSGLERVQPGKPHVGRKA